jgi:hypothetical protein
VLYFADYLIAYRTQTGDSPCDLPVFESGVAWIINSSMAGAMIDIVLAHRTIPNNRDVARSSTRLLFEQPNYASLLPGFKSTFWRFGEGDPGPPIPLLKSPFARGKIESKLSDAPLGTAPVIHGSFYHQHV